ncbi:hypothetical protein AgCh_005293 [Apium graveolens]
MILLRTLILDRGVSFPIGRKKWEEATETLLRGEGSEVWKEKRRELDEQWVDGPFYQSLRGLLSEWDKNKKRRQISTVMSLLDSPVEIRENSIQFSMEMEFCELSPELGEHSEIFEHIRGFNATIVTSANTQDENLPLWSSLLQKEEGESNRKDESWGGVLLLRPTTFMQAFELAQLKEENSQ